MTVKPILFSGPMVRAILDGRKSQTRRVLSLKCLRPGHSVTPELVDYYGHGRLGAIQAAPDGSRSSYVIPLSYAPGDILYVRETWATVNSGEGPGWAYKADSAFRQPDYDGEDFGAGPSFNYDKYPGEYTMWFSDLLAGAECHSWKPSIHMPRWASRLTLEVTDVRIERLLDISEEDAEAEGVFPRFEVDVATFVHGSSAEITRGSTHYLGFKHLWNELNAKRGYGWDANPWVVAVTFKAHHCNVDSMEKLHE